MNWKWKQASLQDLDAIVELSVRHFEHEVADCLTASPVRLAHNIYMALGSQAFDGTHSIYVCEDEQGTLLAYGWIERSGYTIYAEEPIAEVRMVHIDMVLPVKDRVKIIQEMIRMFEQYCDIFNIPVIITNTIRKDTAGFLKLHEKLGYETRGSFAFKRLGEKK